MECKPEQKKTSETTAGPAKDKVGAKSHGRAALPCRAEPDLLCQYSDIYYFVQIDVLGK